MTRKQKMVKSFISLILLFSSLEAISFFLGRELRRRTTLLYTSPDITIEGYRDYLRLRDTVLGWPSPASIGRANYESDGSRVSPAFPIQTDACISLYGDSFVWSQDVKNEYTWGNRLSQATNCRVSNFGVNGYGTDQAFLRYRHNLKDDAPVVILGHMSENIRRNVNRYRHLLSPPASYGLKPRFVLDHEKTLELLPMPTISERAFLDFVENPENYLQSEFFLPNGPSGLSKLEFPYFWSLLQAFGDYRIGARLRGEPGYVEFYSPGHPSQGLGVTAGILEAFYREAIRRGQRPLVILIPTRFDLIEYRESRHWIYKSLLSLSEERYIQTINLGDGILEYLGDRHPDELFSYPGLYYGSHFNNEGNGIIAEIVYRYLLEGEYLP